MQPADTRSEETENLKRQVTKEIKNANQKPPSKGPDAFTDEIY